MPRMRRVAALGASAFALAATSLFGATSAHATDANACRHPDVAADGLYVHTCINWVLYDGHSVWGTANTYGTNNTSINLCVQILDDNLNVIPNSTACKVVSGPSGSVTGPRVSVGYGFYYAQSYFTSPTYFYGGMSEGLCNSC